MVIDSSIQTVVFDLDGTLYNKKGLACKMVCRLWRTLPLLIAERKTRSAMSAIPFECEKDFYHYLFTIMAQKSHKTIEQTKAWYNDIYMPTMVRLIANQPVRKNVVQLLHECKQKGLQTILLSDYGCAEEKLKVLGIPLDAFDYITDAPSWGALKPQTSLLLPLLEYCNANPQTTLFVGDRDDKDGASARAIGARFMHVAH